MAMLCDTTGKSIPKIKPRESGKYLHVMLYTKDSLRITKLMVGVARYTMEMATLKDSFKTECCMGTADMLMVKEKLRRDSGLKVSSQTKKKKERLNVFSKTLAKFLN